MKEYISIGYLLNNAARLARKDLTNRMNDIGLTSPQWMVIRDLCTHKDADSNELTMAAIARRMNSNRANIMGITDRLEALGLVQRTVNPQDRRAQILTLTDKAKKLLSELEEMSKQTTDKAFQGFSQQERQMVMDFLDRIIANLA